MPISNKGSVLVWVGLAVSHLLFAAAAQAQSVSFSVPLEFGVGSEPLSVAVGDFNGDGALDLVVTYGSASVGGLSVLLGNGDGSFQPAESVGAGSYPISVAVGDFNGDGLLDLAVANIGSCIVSSNVSVLLGN